MWHKGILIFWAASKSRATINQTIKTRFIYQYYANNIRDICILALVCDKLSESSLLFSLDTLRNSLEILPMKKVLSADEMERNLECQIRPMKILLNIFYRYEHLPAPKPSLSHMIHKIHHQFAHCGHDRDHQRERESKRRISSTKKKHRDDFELELELNLSLAHALSLVKQICSYLFAHQRSAVDHS